jgi:hypothetical protein
MREINAAQSVEIMWRLEEHCSSVLRPQKGRARVIVNQAVVVQIARGTSCKPMVEVGDTHTGLIRPLWAPDRRNARHHRRTAKRRRGNCVQGFAKAKSAVGGRIRCSEER